MQLKCFKCHHLLNKAEHWHGLHHICFKKWFNTTSAEKFQNIISRNTSNEILPNRITNSSFFHGKFRKYSATLGQKKYILKIEEKDYPELPATEFLCNQIFKNLKINIPPFYLILFENEHKCFVTENFMANLTSSSLVHIHHFFKKKMNYDCNNILKIIENKTGRISAKKDFIYLTLADSLIGNNDRHGRNLSFIQTNKGFFLSPFYDNPSYLGTEIQSLLGADHHPAGAIHTKTETEPSMKDYIHEWERLGYSDVINRFRKNVSLQKITKLINNSFLTSKRKNAILKLINKRIEELWN